MAGIYSKENISNIYTLSPMQEGIFIEMKLFSHSTSYTTQVCFEMHGSFQIEKFQQALGCLKRRHDILRTIFVETKDGKLLQMVLKRQHDEVQYLDCSTLIESHKKVNSIREEEFNRPFDLSKGPLLRVYVIKRSQDFHTILFTFQHIILDGWSLYAILHELLYLYETGNENGLKKETPFVEYIRWIMGNNQEQQAGYWNKYLAGYTRPAVIPVIHTIDVAHFHLSEYSIMLGNDQMEKLRQYVLNRKVTLYSIMLTCWAFVLSGFNNKNDVVFGTVTAGRNAGIEGIKDIIGVMANTIPVRVIFPANARMQDVIRTVHLESIGNESQHYVSLAAIQSYSPLKQDLFDHIFIYENIEWTDVHGSKAAFNEMEIKNFQIHGHSHYNLEIVIYPHEQRIQFLYNNLVIDGDFIRTIGMYLLEILDAVVNDTEIMVNSIMQVSSPPVESEAPEFTDF